MQKQYGARDFLKRYSHWVDDESTRRLRFLRPQKAIVPYLNKGQLSYEERIAIGTRSKVIGSYYAVVGSVHCFSEEVDGWHIIKKGLLFLFWAHRIACRARDFWEVSLSEPQRSFADAAIISADVSLSMAIARTEATWYLDLMERSLKDGSLRWSGDDFFPAYLLRLYHKLKRQSDITDIPHKADNWEHPFDDLIDCWDDEEKLAKAILAMCNYHYQWNNVETEDRTAEFTKPIAILNPVEIHALEAVRTELGLSTPTVEHELLQPPFYPIPDFAKKITTEEILAEDDLLRRIVELNQPWCDGLEE